jgi:transcriptional regulator with XRE-family HTH domain
MGFEEKLRKQMQLKGFNQQKLAKLSSVSDSEISRILTGKSSNPGIDNALKLARAVGVSLDYLADDDMNEDHPRTNELASQESPPSLTEAEIITAARELGTRQSRRILETAADLGYEIAMKRLLGI